MNSELIDALLEHWRFWGMRTEEALRERASVLVKDLTQANWIEKEILPKLIDQVGNEGWGELANVVAARFNEISNLEKIETERVAALAAEREEAIRKAAAEKIEAERLAAIGREKRSAFLAELRTRLDDDFLSCDSFFRDHCDGLISDQEFELEKKTYVKSWFARQPECAISGARAPDEEQLAAIAAVHGHIQVVARAGGGKTTTLVRRAAFLIRHCHVPPEQILILAFNRKAALEVRRRLLGILKEGADSAVAAEIERRRSTLGHGRRVKADEIEDRAVDVVSSTYNVSLPHVMTFHALAYAIVHPEEAIIYNDSDGDAQGLSRVVQQVIDDHLHNSEFRNEIRDIMLAHFREDWDRIVDGRYNKTKQEFLQFRRSIPRESIGGEYVKSYGEKVIADFLFEHDVAYKYERNHWWNGRNYRPDFTIFKTPSSGVVIEYFGLIGDADYDNMSEEKRIYWSEKPNWTLLEFEPEDVARGGVGQFNELLKASLEEQGVCCVRLSEDEIWERVRDRAIDRFTTTTVGFIGRCRKQSLSPLALQERIDAYSAISQVENMFLGVANRLYRAYIDRLAASGEDDFDGLMQRAADMVLNGQTRFQRKSSSGDLTLLRYIFIDEFQDFSDLFYRILSAIRKKNPGVELFCVGDDWQAINGFAGSDLRFFENFEEHVGPSRRLYISTNYRSSEKIVAVGNALMYGRGKPAVAHKKEEGRVLVADLNHFEPTLIEKQRHPGDVVTVAVSRVANRALAKNDDVVMLCRRNGLPWFINYQEGEAVKGRGLARFLDLVRSCFHPGIRDRIGISTSHKFKGAEKRMVIVLDAVARSYPLIHPDWAFSRILGDSPEKITEEERRLLYVALTRAIDTLVIVTDGQNKSPFLEEVERRQPLDPINWSDYPPIQGGTSRVVVKVGNQERRGGAPTFAIKELLKASGYRWQSAGWPGWSKSFPAAGFDCAVLEAEVWASVADGIEVQIQDETETPISCYLVDGGRWRESVDRLRQRQRAAADTESADDYF